MGIVSHASLVMNSCKVEYITSSLNSSTNSESVNHWEHAWRAKGGPIMSVGCRTAVPVEKDGYIHGSATSGRDMLDYSPVERDDSPDRVPVSPVDCLSADI